MIISKTLKNDHMVAKNRFSLFKYKNHDTDRK